MMINKSKESFFLKTVIAIFLIKGLFLIFFIPPWDAPDETSHISYVLWLNNFGKLPGSGTKFSFKSIEDSFIESKRKMISAVEGKAEINGKEELLDRKSSETVLGFTPIASYPPVYYYFLLPFYKLSLILSSYSSLLLLRLSSVLLGIISLILAFRIFKIIAPKSRIIILTTLTIIALHPQFSFISSVVNSDNMVIFAFLLFLYQSLVYWEKEMISKTDLLTLGFFSGLFCLIKPQLIITPLLFWIFLFFNRKRMPIRIEIPVISSLLFPVLWYGRQYLLLKQNALTFFVSGVQKDVGLLFSYPLDFILGKQPIGVFMSFWGYFGWIDVPMPDSGYLIFLLFILISIFGWVIYFKNQPKMNLEWIRKPKHLFLILSTLIYFLVIVFYDWYWHYLTATFSINGRYFFPILPFLMLFLVRGVYFFPKKSAKTLTVLLIFMLLITNIYAFTTISRKYYGGIWPKFLPLSFYKIIPHKGE